MPSCLPNLRTTQAIFRQINGRNDIRAVLQWRMENLFEKPNQQYVWPYCHQKSGHTSILECEAEEVSFIFDYGVNYVDLYGSEKWKFHMLRNIYFYTQIGVGIAL